MNGNSVRKAAKKSSSTSGPTTKRDGRVEAGLLRKKYFFEVLKKKF